MMSKVELTDFQKRFFAQGTGQQLFTAKEFEDALAQAKAEIMAVAIQTTKQAIMIERQACAEILEEEMLEQDTAVRGVLEVLAERIRNRIPSQRQ
jgi:hypothetical protein